MKIKLKLGVSEQKKEMEINTDELGYTEDHWDMFDEETKNRLIKNFVYNIESQPYWYLESFKTL